MQNFRVDLSTLRRVHTGFGEGMFALFEARSDVAEGSPAVFRVWTGVAVGLSDAKWQPIWTVNARRKGIRKVVGTIIAILGGRHSPVGPRISCSLAGVPLVCADVDAALENMAKSEPSTCPGFSGDSHGRKYPPTAGSSHAKASVFSDIVTSLWPVNAVAILQDLSSVLCTSLL
jgi:hypothetical protein